MSNSQSIAVDFYHTKNEAQASLVELQDFFSDDTNLLRLQKKHNLQFRIRRMGNYYEILIQPISDPALLEELLSALVLKYKNAYISNIIDDPITMASILDEVRTVLRFKDRSANVSNIELKQKFISQRVSKQETAIASKKTGEILIKKSAKFEPEIIKTSIITLTSYSKFFVIGSFMTDMRAQKSLKKLQRYFKNNDNLLKLKKNHQLDLKVEKNGKYYITLVQAQGSKVVLRKVLNTLKVRYKDTYALHRKATLKKIVNKDKTITLYVPFFRTIVIGSFKTDKRAKKSLVRLGKYFKNNENLLKLQKKYKLELKVEKLGKYYTTLIEPLPNISVLKEVSDILRLKYKDAYRVDINKTPQDNHKKRVDE